MKKNLLFLPAVIFFFVINPTSAQNNDVDRFVADMITIADDFAAPGVEGAALQSSAGWFASAKDLNDWEFEISLHGNGLFIPDSKQKTVFRNEDFSVVRVRGASQEVLPTVFGAATDVVFEGELSLGGQSEAFQFDAIDGFQIGTLIHPFVQATVGLPYGTDVAVRYLPFITLNDVGFSTFGVGLKHNFNQYNKFSQPEDFQFAAVVSYSNFRADYTFSPITLPFDVLELNTIDVNGNLWFFQGVGSKLYGNFEVMAGLGMTNSSFDYTAGGGGLALGLLNNSLNDLRDNEKKFKGDVGFNYYSGNLKISTMFTASNFFNANLGLHFRI